MTPVWTDPWLTVFGGDCREVMAAMEPESVHCVVTSPPYWGLRDYGTASWIGGDEACDHKSGLPRMSDKTTIGRANGGKGEPVLSAPSRVDVQTPYRHTCGKCGATRQDSQLGLEPTPEEYVANMVAVFRAVRRVLRADGTVWCNLGDSFLPGKQLAGIPWRVAFALQTDGWYLRSDIIWSKPNPMPESVTDRPTKAHEYLFLLAKSSRYYFDADAVREPLEQSSIERGKYGWSGKTGDALAMGATPGGGGFNRLKATGETMDALYNPAGRNIRSVWTVATQPYPGAHFATFPEALVEPCVKAGTSERGVCPECGKPWRRVTETTPDNAGYPNGPGGKKHRENPDRQESRQPGNLSEIARYSVRTLGWIRSCAHDLPPVPAVVLDPFAGSGTVGRVAQRLSRRAILIDLNPDYLRQQLERNRDIPLGLGA